MVWALLIKKTLYIKFYSYICLKVSQCIMCIYFYCYYIELTCPYKNFILRQLFIYLCTHQNWVLRVQHCFKHVLKFMLNVSFEIFHLKTFGIVSIMTFKYQYVGDNNPSVIEHPTSFGMVYFIHK